jgi:hypothetical protein
MAVEEAISTNGVDSDWIYFYKKKTDLLSEEVC